MASQKSCSSKRIKFSDNSDIASELEENIINIYGQNEANFQGQGISRPEYGLSPLLETGKRASSMTQLKA